LEPYEMTYIVRPDLDEEQIRAVIDGMNTRIGQTGEVIATYPWNPPRRRMAYPIHDFGDGYYVTTTFRYAPEELREFERGLRLNNNVLRFLIVQATQANIQQSQQRAQQHAARLAGVPQGAPAGQPGTAPAAAGPRPAPASPAQAGPTPAPQVEQVPVQQPTPEPVAVQEPAAPAPEPAAVTPETQE